MTAKTTTALVPAPQARVEANRRNARKSTGPKTTAGKARAKANATIHGLLSKEIFHAHEDNEQVKAEFASVLTNLRDSFSPENSVEDMLVERMAVAWWRLARVLRFELRETKRAISIDGEPLPLRQDDQAGDDEMLAQIRHDPERMLSQLQHGLELIEELEGVIWKRGRLLPENVDRLRIIPGNIHERCAALQPEDGVYVLLEGIVEGDDEKLTMEGRDMLRELKGERVRIERWKQVSELVQRNPKLRALITSPDIPNEQAADRILRYETTIERQFYRAMDQLERLQRSRRGEFVAAPVKARLSVE